MSPLQRSPACVQPLDGCGPLSRGHRCPLPGRRWPEPPCPATTEPLPCILSRRGGSDMGEEEGGVGGERERCGAHLSAPQPLTSPGPALPRHLSEDVFWQMRFHFFCSGPWLKRFSLQMGPWQKNIHIFLTITPNEVKPTLTSSFRRALSVGVTFIMFWHTENDHFAPALIQPPPRENDFRRFFPRASRTFSR